MGVRWLDEIGTDDAASVGSKGANLGELIRLGFSVPAGFVVPVRHYREHVEHCGLVEALAPSIESTDWGAVERTANQIVNAKPLSEELHNELSLALDRLKAAEVAVRSSATAEDLGEASFAGQYRTLLNIHTEDELHRAVKECWASLWCREVFEYRQHQSMDHTSVEMAVIVQAMFPADTAGVLFTIDPVSQRSDRILVEVVPGLSETLVSGMTVGTVLRVERATGEVMGREGTTEALTRKQLDELCRTALKVEAHFECPQDIEFAIGDGKLSLLQTRPITAFGRTLPEQLEPLGKPTFADKMMRPLVTERYPIAPRPLDSLIYTRLVGSAIATLRRSGITCRNSRPRVRYPRCDGSARHNAGAPRR